MVSAYRYRKIFSPIVFLFCLSASFAQSYDSETAFLIKMADSLLSQRERVQEATPYIEKINVIAREKNDPVLRWYSVMFTARAKDFIRDYSSTQHYFDSAYDISLKIKDKSFRLNNLVLRGLFYEITNDWERALNNFLEAKDLAIELNNIPRQAQLNNKVGIIYYREEQYETALGYFMQSLSMYVKLRDNYVERYWIQNVLDNIALCHQDLGRYRKAIFFYKLAIQNAEGIHGAEAAKAVAMSNMAGVYLALGRTDKALELLQSAVAITTRPENHEMEHGLRSLLRLANVYTSRNQIGEAGNTLQRASHLIDSLGLTAVRKEYFNALSLYHEQKKEYAPALAYNKLYNTVQDSVDKVNREQSFSERILNYELNKQKLEYEFLKKEAEIKGLRNKIIIGVTVFILIIAIMLFNNMIKLRKKNDTLNALNRQITEQRNELKVLNRNLQNLNRQKSYLMGTVAHDLRGPIGNVISLNDMLADEPDINNETKELVNLIGLSGRQALAIMGDILDASAIEQNALNLHLTPTRLSDVVNLATKIFAYQARAKRIDIVRELDNDIICNIDPERMVRVVQNLLSNAIKFSHQRGRITISTRVENDRVLLAVKDQGKGIDPEFLKTIFTPYSNAASQGTTGEKPVGLGLSIVKNIIEKHGGSIEVISEPDKGSEFILSLPKLFS